MNWDTIVDDMEVTFIEIDDSLALTVLNIGIRNIPLKRNSPVKDLGPTWNFMNLKGNPLLHASESSPNSIARDASANWI